MDRLLIFVYEPINRESKVNNVRRDGGFGMEFTKMHGIGNDYVYVNDLGGEIVNPEAIAAFISDRHFGIGSDGLILVRPSDKADFMMRMYNADGS